MKLAMLESSLLKTFRRVFGSYGNEVHEGTLDCSTQLLTSLEGCPEVVTGVFSCKQNELTDLKGGPREIGKYYDCSKNPLTSLEGAPKIVKGSFYATETSLASLHNVHKYLPEIHGSAHFTLNFQRQETDIRSHVLGLLLIKGLTFVRIFNDARDDVLNRFIKLKDGHDPMKLVFECQEAMIDLGFEEEAQL